MKKKDPLPAAVCCIAGFCALAAMGLMWVAMMFFGAGKAGFGIGTMTFSLSYFGIAGLLWYLVARGGTQW